LNPLHDEGKHKARLFVAVGITATDAEKLRDILLEVINAREAQLGRRDAYGQRYTLDFPLKWSDKRIIIRSGWIIEQGTDIPRLTTCYPL
jgi:hypothetical protein